MKRARLGMKNLFKPLLCVALLANAASAGATSYPIPTHQVIVSPGKAYDGIQYPVGTQAYLTDDARLSEGGMVMLGPETFAFISGNAVLKLVLR